MRKFTLLLLVMALMLSIAACQKESNSVLPFAEGVTLYGTVTEIRDDYILLQENGDGTLYQVSREGKYADYSTDYQVGDRVMVYYDGIVAEIYPNLVSGVYAIIRVDPGK